MSKPIHTHIYSHTSSSLNTGDDDINIWRLGKNLSSSAPFFSQNTIYYRKIVRNINGSGSVTGYPVGMDRQCLPVQRKHALGFSKMRILYIHILSELLGEIEGHRSGEY